MIGSMSRPVATMRLDLERVHEAMRRRGIKDASELARLVHTKPSTTLRWLTGQTTPSGDNLARLASVLAVSIPWMMGAKEIGVREGIVRALREHLAVETATGTAAPEAEIVEAMGELTEQQRVTLRDAVIGLLPTVRGIAHLHDRPAAETSTQASRASVVTQKPHRNRRVR
jgi:hypothetical protein